MRISDWSSDVCSSDLPWSSAIRAAARTATHPRDGSVLRCGGTGFLRICQTCALPCWSEPMRRPQCLGAAECRIGCAITVNTCPNCRSEERRVGKESVRTCRSGRSKYHKKKKKYKKIQSHFLNKSITRFVHIQMTNIKPKF